MAVQRTLELDYECKRQFAVHLKLTQESFKDLQRAVAEGKVFFRCGGSLTAKNDPVLTVGGKSYNCSSNALPKEQPVHIVRCPADFAGRECVELASVKLKANVKRCLNQAYGSEVRKRGQQHEQALRSRHTIQMETTDVKKGKKNTITTAGKLLNASKIQAAKVPASAGASAAGGRLSAKGGVFSEEELQPRVSRAGLAKAESKQNGSKNQASRPQATADVVTNSGGPRPAPGSKEAAASNGSTRKPGEQPQTSGKQGASTKGASGSKLVPDELQERRATEAAKQQDLRSCLLALLCKTPLTKSSLDNHVRRAYQRAARTQPPMGKVLQSIAYVRSPGQYVLREKPLREAEAVLAGTAQGGASPPGAAASAGSHPGSPAEAARQQQPGSSGSVPVGSKRAPQIDVEAAAAEPARRKARPQQASGSSEEVDTPGVVSGREPTPVPDGGPLPAAAKLPSGRPTMAAVSAPAKPAASAPSARDSKQESAPRAEPRPPAAAAAAERGVQGSGQRSRRALPAPQEEDESWFASVLSSSGGAGGGGGGGGISSKAVFLQLQQEYEEKYVVYAKLNGRVREFQTVVEGLEAQRAAAADAAAAAEVEWEMRCQWSLKGAAFMRWSAALRQLHDQLEPLRRQLKAFASAYGKPAAAPAAPAPAAVLEQ